MLAKAAGLSEELEVSSALGSAYGFSAIIRARCHQCQEEDASYAIATILIFGAIMLAVYPLIGHLTNMSSEMFGFWTGLSIDNTAEAIATGMAFSEQAAEGHSVSFPQRPHGLRDSAVCAAPCQPRTDQANDNRWAFLWAVSLVRLRISVLSALKTAGLFNPMQTKILVNMSNWAFLLTFAE